jgi:hypothetical protein
MAASEGRKVQRGRTGERVEETPGSKRQMAAPESAEAAESMTKERTFDLNPEGGYGWRTVSRCAGGWKKDEREGVGSEAQRLRQVG